MPRRRALWAVAGLVLILVSLTGGTAAWMHSDGARHRVERILGEALGRTVAIESMDVGWSSVMLQGVTVENPAAFPGAPLLRAGAVELDVSLPAILRRQLVGSLSVRDVHVRLARKGGTTNVSGMLPSRTRGSQTNLDLTLELTDGVVTLDDLDTAEKLELRQVGLAMALTNHDTERDVSAEISIARVRVRDVGVDQVHATIVANRDRVEISELTAAIGDAGTVSAHGAAELRDGLTWDCAITVADVSLDRDVAAAVSAFYPGFGSAQPPPGGTVSLTSTVRGQSLSTADLTGDLDLRLHDIRFGDDTLIAEVAKFAGVTDPIAVDRVVVRGTMADGWFNLLEVSSSPENDLLTLRGRVSLEGELDLNVDLLPVVRRASVGIYSSVRDVASSIPIRIVGTTANPKVAAPRGGDVATSLLGGLIHRTLE